MKKIKKKGILQKTIIVILMVLTLNFIVPTYSRANIGGVLMDPIVDLFCSLGDAVINLLQKCMTGDWGAGFSLDGGFLVESTTFFSDNKYSDKWTNQEGEYINPYAEKDGFNKTLLFNNTQDYHIPIATYSPEKIFSGKVQGLDINFIDPDTDMDEDGKEDKDDKGNYLNTAKRLQPTIAKWYVALRNLTIVGLLSVLVYVGIRIIISSTASDKAKYKQMLVDWLIALCLVFFLHYIMSFTITLTQSICNAISGSGDETVIITLQQEGGEKKSFETNLLGSARLKTQYNDFGPKITYLIMYLALVIYTCIFTFFYLKRLLMMAFLTIIAPVVALTYPIDKISDGKAQAFDMWLKEYIFNALIQPFHLIIYTVLVGTAMDLASTNIIYTIAALAFMMPAEKILRKFFGFEKAGAGTLGGLVGAAAAGSLARKALSGRGGSGGKGGSGKDKDEGEKPPRFEDKNNNINQLDTPEGQDAPNIDNNADNNLNNNNNNIFDDDQMNEYYNTFDDGSDDDRTLEQRMQDIENEDFYYQGNPEWLRLNEERQRREYEQQQREQQRQTQQQTQPQPQTQQEDANNRVSFLQGMNNLRRHHNLTRRGIGNAAIKGIKGIGKFGVRTAFSAGAGTLAGAVAIASGGGLAGGAAAFATGAGLGNRAANGVIGAVSSIPSTVRREIDVFHGNSDQQNKQEIKDWYKDEDNFNYFRDKMTKDNGGVIPSDKQVKEEMQRYDPYLQRDIKDIKDMIKAQKLAETYNIDPKDMALIMAIEKKDGVTKEMLSDKNKANAYQENLTHQLSSTKSPEDAQKTAQFAVNVMKERNGVANNLRKQPDRQRNNNN